MRTRAMILGLGLGLLAGMAQPPNARASACGMGDDIDWYAGERSKVSEAVDLLEQGRARDAAWVVQNVWPRLREARPVEGGLPHIAEAVRVMALASVRTSGDVNPGFGWTSRTAADRASNVRWGISRLRMLAAASPSSVMLEQNLGEALTASTETATEGNGILETLDRRHAITTPGAFVALARTRKLHGDEEGAAVALAQCETLEVSQDQCSESEAPPVVTASSVP